MNPYPRVNNTVGSIDKKMIKLQHAIKIIDMWRIAVVMSVADFIGVFIKSDSVNAIIIKRAHKKVCPSHLAQYD